jgi:ABC-type Mn2+/Zn2+ transport system permease subunit
MGEQMRQASLFISLAIIGLGLYLKFFYDVPDSQETINFFTSWFFIIVGISSLLINLFWNPHKKNSNKNPE